MTSAFEWNGRVGDVWAEEWRRTDRSFTDLSRQLDAAILEAAPESGAAIDIGCGAGGTSIALATARPRLAVVGVDLSPALVAIAAERAQGIDNLSFRVGDARDLPHASADFLFSRHGVMFFDDPVAGFAALRAVARPGARLVFSCFRARADNQWALTAEAAVGNSGAPTTTYAPGPFALADRDFTARVLREAGWRDPEARSADFAYVAGAGDDPVADAMSFFSRIGPAARALAAAPPDRRAAMRDKLAAALADHVTNGTVTFRGAAWIWSAIAGERP
ncbi:class I SAM-dependent methyltransferase [Sphingomonas sp.]|jgi:SAM-dependent methyltransferase|uniref:class I SAM-dependent methyltransferase n=1 Tax=Sphingomonas sp. TaxID=28214 RepID=UPI002E37CB48|nr:class I SAM-dependent methyltransferase [Sphingomonas sp.]HEX4693543.1 class I SAM-dependent methyltransferase [Sphingomonas sp.]